jgi:hypothetical protein
MSINFCTLTNSSVDTFCGNRRSIVLNGLLKQKYPVRGTNNRVVSQSFANLRPDLVRRDDADERPTLVYEQPLITVEVILDGVRMEHTLQAEQRLDFVTVTDLVVSGHPVTEETITISDLTIDGITFTIGH